jgi:hypothetical protein
MKRVDTSLSVIVTAMNRVDTSLSVIVTKKKCLLSLRQATTSQKELSALFMTGYDFPKRSVCSLYDRLRLPKKNCLLSL